MRFFRKHPHTHRFLLKRFTIQKKEETIDRPYTDTCICAHGDFQHNWYMLFVFIKHTNCRACKCEKFRNIGKMGFTDRYTLSGGLPMLKLQPSHELEVIIEKIKLGYEI